MSTHTKRKWHSQKQKQPKRLKNKSSDTAFEGSHEEVLLADVRSLLSTKSSSSLALNGRTSVSPPPPSLPERWSVVEVRIAEISSTGDGIGFAGDSEHVYAVPFSLPGELVKAKVAHTFADSKYSLADFIEIIEPSGLRDPGRVRCQYFSRCGGCQFQMLSYEDQLAHKRSVIAKAYKSFSGLKPELVPNINEVVGSPLQYGYRTKLTPHFNQPKQSKEHPTEIPPIGFLQKGRRLVIDVEDCPIGTDVVREGMRKERDRVAREIDSFTKGATLLLRESSEPRPTGSPADDDTSVATPVKHCVTKGPELAREYVDDFVFEQPAGLFFQNNNSILPRFTQYIRGQVTGNALNPPLTQLIDAYCGSGLFTVTLSSLFSTSIGIDIQSGVIEGARHNAKLNRVKNATFMTATASAIFESLPDEADPDRTAVIIDPPRKGCDADFLRQLLRFNPRRIVYVSCNCHTQARDIGVLVTNSQGGSEYKIESLRGFDFFPQTSHVESVAVLQRVNRSESVTAS